MESLKNLTFSLKLPLKVVENLRILINLKKIWPEVLGDKSSLAFPLYFEEGVLYVGVTDHYELQNLNCLHGEILKKLKALYPAENFSIKVLKFLYRPLTHQSKFLGQQKEISLCFSDSSWREIEDLCNNLPDSELGKLLLKVVKSHQRNVLAS